MKRDDRESVKKLIINKGICFGDSRVVINCSYCVLQNHCEEGVENNTDIPGDLQHQRYLLAVALAEEGLTPSELFELLL